MTKEQPLLISFTEKGRKMGLDMCSEMEFFLEQLPEKTALSEILKKIPALKFIDQNNKPYNEKINTQRRQTIKAYCTVAGNMGIKTVASAKKNLKRIKKNLSLPYVR